MAGNVDGEFVVPGRRAVVGIGWEKHGAAGMAIRSRTIGHL